MSGGGDLPSYDPALLVQELRLIVVRVTYRLGLFGFVGSASETATGNLGLLDIMEAIRWTQAHISAFGGDPENLTIAGQSSGGDAIAHLLIADGARDLIRRVIIMSAPLGNLTSRARITPHLRRMVSARDIEQWSPARVLTLQRRLSRRSVLLGPLKGGMAFGPIFGHVPLPSLAQAKNRWAASAPGLEVLIGYTSSETSSFGYMSRTLQALRGMPLVGERCYRALVDITTNTIYRKANNSFARFLADNGARVTRYELLFDPAGSKIGAGHILDVALLFAGPTWEKSPLLGTNAATSLADGGRLIRAVWGAFARAGWR